MKAAIRKTADQQRALKLLAGPAQNILLFGGSRSGKTFLLVYALLVRALRAPGSRHIVLRRCANAAYASVRRDTLEKVRRLAFPSLHWHENRSERCITLRNGSEIWFGGLDNDDRSDRILGREYATVYCNECSELQYASVNTALTRLAQKTELQCRAYFDCNPSGRSHWSYQLFVEHRDPVSRVPLAHPEQYVSLLMNPAGNAENLPSGYLENTLGALSERQRRRFLLGEWLADTEGALWQQERIDRARVLRPPEELLRVVIGVDPAVTANSASDCTGIVGAALGRDGFYYVLEDASLKGSVLEWTNAVSALYRKYRADRVVCETNNGGDLVLSVLRTAAPELSCRAVYASRGKLARAEPVAALYEQGKVRHAGVFRELEDEMCSYNPLTAQHSPDRMDALVWALTELSCSPGTPRCITA